MGGIYDDVRVTHDDEVQEKDAVPSTRLLLLFLRYGTQRGLISQSGGAPPRVFSIASSRNLAVRGPRDHLGSRFLSHGKSGR